MRYFPAPRNGAGMTPDDSSSWVMNPGDPTSVVLGDASQIPITWVVLIDTGYIRVVSGVFQRDHLAALVGGHVVEHARTEGWAADAGGRPTAVAPNEPTPRMANNAVFIMCSPPRILGRSPHATRSPQESQER